MEEIEYGNEFEHPQEEHDSHQAALDKERALNEAYGKVIAGVASDADYVVLRQIATESFPVGAPKFNPRYVSTTVATENVQHLHNAIKVGIILSLVALLAAIFKTFLGGGKEGGSGGGGGKGATVAAKAKPLETKPPIVIEPVSQGLTGLQDKLTQVLKSAPKELEEEKFIEKCCKDLGTMYASQGKKPEDFQAFAKKLFHVLMASRRFFGTKEDYDIPGYADMLKLYNGRFACGQILANKGILDRHQFLRYAFLHNEAMNTPVMSLKDFADQVENIDQHIEYHKDLDTMGRQLLDKPDPSPMQEWDNLKAAFLSTDGKVGQENSYFTKAEGKEFLDKLKAEFTILPVESIDLAKMQHVFSDKTMSDLQARYLRCEEINDGVNRAMRDCGPEGEITRFIKEELQFKIEDLKKEIEQDGKDSAIGQTKVRWKQQIETYVKVYEGYLYTTKTLVQALTGLRNSTDKVAVGLVASFDEISALGKSLMELEAIVTKTFSGLSGISKESFHGHDGSDTEHNEYIESTPAKVEGVVGDDNIILPEHFDIDALDQLDVSEMEHEEMSDVINDCNEDHAAMHADELAMEQFCDHVRKSGRISKQIVQDVESIQPGLITKKIPLGRFTSFESTTNANVSLESMEGLQKGLKLAAAVAGAALLVKMILWIRNKYGMITDTTKAITGKLAMAKTDMATAYKNIGDIESQNTQPDDDVRTAISGRIKDLGVADAFNFGSPRDSFNKVRDAVLWAKCNPYWSEGTLELANHGGTAKALQELGKLVDSGVTLLSNTLTKLDKVVKESKGGDNVNLSVEATPYDFKAVLSALGLSEGPGNAETIEIILTEIKKRLTPLNDQGKFKTEVLSKFTETAPVLVKGMEGRALKEIEKIEKQSTDLQKEISAMPSDTKSSSLSAGSMVVKSDTKTLTDIVQAYNLILNAAKGLSSAFSDGAKDLKDLTDVYLKGSKKATK